MIDALAIVLVSIALGVTTLRAVMLDRDTPWFGRDPDDAAGPRRPEDGRRGPRRGRKDGSRR